MSTTTPSYDATRVAVPTPSGAYTVHVGAHILEAAVGQALASTTHAQRALIIKDSNIPEAYLAQIQQGLDAQGVKSLSHVFPAGEKNKRFVTLEAMLDACAASELDRSDAVIALGGGVTGDMAGLAGALYLRGIDVIQVPTSLLSMVDSSVGGKTAVDLASGKNLAGAFLQPRAVVADVATLQTLSPQLFQDGLGEVIKHAVLADDELLEALIGTPFDAHTTPSERLIELVAKNVSIKRDVVVQDERESGLRRVLNLGHTIGHAIEAASNFELGHGSCVAAGLCCMLRGSLELGWTQNTQLLDRVERACATQGLPTNTALDHDVLFNFATHDKKRAAQHMNLVLADQVGAPYIKSVSLPELKRVIDAGCTGK